VNFSSTLLPQTNDPVEIQKAFLDLLAKLNQVSSEVTENNKLFEPVSQRTTTGAVGWFDAVPINNGSSLTFPTLGTWEWVVTTPHDGNYGTGNLVSGLTTGKSIPGTANQDVIIYYKRIA
jgi:hypothetical protein